jgi:RNA polymerase primary sigma factor
MNKDILIDQIVGYANSNLINTDNKKIALKELEKLFKYVDCLNLKNSTGKKIIISFNFDNYNVLFAKSDILYTLVNTIVGEEAITQEQLDKLSENENIVEMINAYCVTNNLINEDEFEEKQNDDYEPRDDIVKADITNDIFRELGKYSVLTKEQEIDLFKRYNNGDKGVRDTIVTHNLRLVASVTKRYVGRGLPFEDLYQEGSLGLIKAIDLFDYTKGYKFSTYAIWWIRQAIARSLANNSRTIRIPVHVDLNVRRIERAISSFEMENGRTPTTEELSKMTNISINEIKNFYKLPELVSTSVIVENSSKKDSKRDAELGDFLEDITHNTENDAISSTLKDEIVILLKNAKLEKRERAIIIYRNGLDGNVPKTLEECGKIFHITRERARQLEWKALKALRRYACSRKTEEYTDDPSRAREYALLNMQGKKERRIY